MAAPSIESPNPATVRELLSKAVKKFGSNSQRKFALKCGVTQQTISKAIISGHVSLELALAIHHATGGEIDRGELCPQLRTLL